MHITVNGEATQVDNAASISSLIEQLGLGARRIAIERNGEIVPRSAHAQARLVEGDAIEIVHALGGG